MRKVWIFALVIILCCMLCGSVTASEYTVVRCTDQVTYPFSASVSGAVGVTVRDDNNNYFRYYPTTDNLVSLAGSPAEYSWDVVYQTEYIQPTGNQYINTGYYATSYFNSELKVNFISVSYHQITLVSSWKSIVKNYGINVGLRDNKIGLYGQNTGTNDWWTPVTVYTGSDYVVKSSINRNSRSIIVNGVSYTISVSSTFEPSVPVYVFANGNPVVYDNTHPVKLYYLKFFDDLDTLVRDYIPIKYGTTYALYDNCLSGNVIYGNSGTGAFTGGGTETPLTYEHGPSIVSVSLSPGQPSTIITGQNVFVDVVLSGVDKTDEGNILVSLFDSNNPSGLAHSFEYGYFSNMDNNGKITVEVRIHPTVQMSGELYFISTANFTTYAELIDTTKGMEGYAHSYSDFNIPYIYVVMVEPLTNLTWLSQATYHYPDDNFRLNIQSLSKYSGKYSWQYRQISPSIGPLSEVFATSPEYQTSASELGLVSGNTYEFICSLRYTTSYTHQYIANQTVTVWEDPVPNMPGGPLVPVAVPYTATLTATSVNERMVTKYVWQQQIGGTWSDVHTGTQYEPSFTTPGSYPFRFTAYGVNQVNVSSPVITIQAGYKPYALITQPVSGAEIESGEIQILGVAGGTNATYTWSYGDYVISHGTDTGTVNAEQMNINSSVLYDAEHAERKTLTLTVSNNYGPTAVYSVQFTFGNTKQTLRDPAHSEVTRVDSGGMYGLINDTRPQSEDNQMPDMGKMVSDIVKPFTNVMGEWFYLALFAIPYLIIFLRQKNILIPSIIGVLFAAWLLIFLPGAAMKAAIGIIVLCVAGGIFGLYINRR